MIGGSGDISMTNIETIFILLLPLIPRNLFNLNGKIFPVVIYPKVSSFVCLLIFGLPFLKFNKRPCRLAWMMR